MKGFDLENDKSESNDLKESNYNFNQTNEDLNDDEISNKLDNTSYQVDEAFHSNVVNSPLRPSKIKIYSMIGLFVIVSVIIGILLISSNNKYSDRNLESIGFIYDEDSDLWKLNVTDYDSFSMCIVWKSFDTRSFSRFVDDEAINEQTVVACSDGTNQISYLTESNVHIAQVVSITELLSQLLAGRSYERAEELATDTVSYGYNGEGYLYNLDLPRDSTSTYFDLVFDFHDFMEETFDVSLD